MMNFRYKLKNEKGIKPSIYFNTNTNKNLDDIKLLLESSENINVYPNSEDEDEHVNNSYKNITEYIYRIVTKTGFLCKGLNPEYIIESFDKVDAVVVISSSENILPNGNIFGFALIEFNEKYNSIYIDVICSHIGIQGAGDSLIKAVEKMNDTLLMKYIYLNSVKSAISFYEKYGFSKQDKLCDDMCLMIKKVNKKLGGKKTKSIKNKRHTKSKNMIRHKKHKTRKNYL